LELSLFSVTLCPVTESLFQSLAAAAATGQPVALGIITGVKGSSPQKLGAKALFYPDRKIKGTLGGGCLEAEAQRLALKSLQTGQPTSFELILDHDFGWDDGLICGGKVMGLVLPNAQQLGEKFWLELAQRDTAKSWGVKSDFGVVRREDPTDSSGWRYTETTVPPCELWIAGSGHVAQAVAPLAQKLDFAVTIFDDRPELANHEYFPQETRIQVGNWGEILSHPLPTSPTFGLIVTRGHNHDALVLESWIHQPFAFLGMIGSQRKWRMISEKFISAKIASAEQLARVICPVGIKIGSQSVMEIAVSIVAQLIEKRAALQLPSKT